METAPTGVGETDRRAALEPVDVATADSEQTKFGDAANREARRLAVVGELAGVAFLALVLTSAAVIARFSAGDLAVQVPQMAGWAFGAALLGLPLGAVHASRLPAVSQYRRPLVGLLLLGELSCLTGLVSVAGGIAGPYWIVFVPVVLLTAAAAGAEVGMAIGGLAAAGVYVASLVSHTVNNGDIGRLVVVLPVFPAAAFVGAAVGSAVRRAAWETEAERAGLERDLASLQAALDQVAAGDLTAVPSVTPGADPTAAVVAVSLADTVVALRRLTRGIASGAESIAGEVHHLVGSAEGLAAGAAQQTSSITEVTSTVEELTSTSSQIADTASSVADFAAVTLRYADEGQVAVAASVEAMATIASRVDHISSRAARLADCANRIERILGFIDDLATQTNMLAFNAAIEAARVGDRGKGFAVVATEIRSLAERARECTGQVGDLVGEIRAEAERTRDMTLDGAADVRVGSELTAEVAGALDRIAGMVDDTTAAAREISIVTGAQRGASEAVVTAMSRVAEVSAHYSSVSRSARDAATRLDGLVGELREGCQRFKVA